MFTYEEPPARTYPGGKQVLKDIYLSFYPGAKIGVIGLNGSGKSTLLRSAHRDRVRAGSGRRGRGQLSAAGTSSIRPKTCSASDVKAVAAKKAIFDRYTRSPPTTRRDGEDAGSDRRA
jgi:ABC-type phosphate/phosphonate transport system ATPase subunit